MVLKEELNEMKKKNEEKAELNHVSMEDITGDNKKTDINSLDDDDEFEEFQVEDWTEADTDIGISKDKLWDDNWDDDDIEDSFSVSLRAELQKSQISSI